MLCCDCCSGAVVEVTLIIARSTALQIAVYTPVSSIVLFRVLYVIYSYLSHSSSAQAGGVVRPYHAVNIDPPLQFKVVNFFLCENARSMVMMYTYLHWPIEYCHNYCTYQLVSSIRFQ